MATITSMSAGEWQPATIDEVTEIIQEDLASCDSEQLQAFNRYRVQPYAAPINRYGNQETVIIVAQRENEVVYWEDIDEGFNVSPIDKDGTILEHWCNQDQLGHALNRWIPGRSGGGKFGPAQPIS